MALRAEVLIIIVQKAVLEKKQIMFRILGLESSHFAYT
jgi:hypothetical protein